jgi:putative ABC transport system permease protein
MSVAEHPDWQQVIVARTPLGPSAVRRSLLGAVAATSPGSSASITTVNDLAMRTVAAPRVRAFVLASFAGLALILAAIGVYGVAAHVTAQRTAEMGIRMALGARPAQVLRAVGGRIVSCAAVGLGIGLTVAMATAQLIQAFLYGVGPRDVVTFAAAAAVVVVVAGLATWIPARRATLIDPTEALRAE